MRGKIHSLNNNIIQSSINYNILCFTETNFDQLIDSSLINNNKSTIHRCDRDLSKTNKAKGGGVMLIINNPLKSKTVLAISNFFELLVVEISFDHLKIILCLVYFPPTAISRYYCELFQQIENIIQIFNKHTVLIIGDFNLPGYTWNNSFGYSSITGHHNNVIIRDSINQLLSIINNYNFKQYNFFQNISGNILDLCFSNTNIKVNNCIDPLLKIDLYHGALQLELEIGNLSYLSFTNLAYNFKKGNYLKINSKLNEINWDSILSKENDVNNQVLIFENLINELIQINVPQYIIKNSSYPKWYTNELIKAIIQKKICINNTKLI